MIKRDVSENIFANRLLSLTSTIEVKAAMLMVSCRLAAANSTSTDFVLYQLHTEHQKKNINKPKHYEIQFVHELQ